MTIFCKRISWRNHFSPANPHYVLAVVLSDSNDFVVFKTGSGRTYEVRKTEILSVSDTDIPFVVAGQET